MKASPVTKTLTLAATLVVACAIASAPARAADAFAPVGAKATLDVEYRYESKGKFVGTGSSKYELHEWKALRTVEMSAELVAAKPLPLPQMQAPDGAQTARVQQQRAQVQKAAQQTAPMIAGAEAIVAKCGNDEKCMEREAMKMGAAMAGTQQLEDTMKVGARTAAAMQPGANRYQVWRATELKGNYAIDESWRIIHADPGCMVLPGARCTRNHVAKGGGAVPPPPKGAAGPSAVEVDAQANTLTLQLPVPMGVLTYTETVESNEPKGTQEVPPGTHARSAKFRAAANGKASPSTPFTVPLQAGWHSQSGESMVPIAGEGRDGGTLRIRWRFTAQ